MPQPISIRTTAGIRLDVYATETIEVNVGGVSLLSLDARTQTYTNTFKLPRTPVNEQAFAYASQPTRANTAELSVIVTKGLFSQSAKLKVTAFEKEYSCTLTYDYEGVLGILSGMNFYTLPEYGVHTVISGDFPSDDEVLTAATTPQTDGRCFSLMMYQSKIGYSFMTVASFLSRITTLTGITFSGDMITDTDWGFLDAVIFNKNVSFTYVEGVTYDLIQIVNTTTTDFLSCSSVLKVLSQMYLFDVVITGMNIELKSIPTLVTQTPLTVEGFTFSKDIYSGYGATNKIKYKVDPTIEDGFYGEVFTSNGVGAKTALEIASFIPINYADTVSPYVRGGYDPLNSNALKEIVIMVVTNISASANYLMTWPAYGITSSSTFTSLTGIPYALTPTYGTTNIMDCMATPVILNADGYLNPLQASQLMSGRLLFSVQMGGKYWVDEMKYNLTTGKSVLKLIKL